MNTKRNLLIFILTGTLIALLAAACSPAVTPAPTLAPPDPVTVVQDYYGALNAKELDKAMTFIADGAVFINPMGAFRGRDEIRESLQLVIDEGITFELSNFQDTNGRVVYHYQVIIDGNVVEEADGGLTTVQGGKIIFDGTEATEEAVR